MAAIPPITTIADNETTEIAESPAAPGTIFELPCIDNRERALPVRQGDLVRLLLSERGLKSDERELLADFGRLLGATFHSEFYEKLRQLKELYAPIDPDADYVTLPGHTRPFTEYADEEFLTPFGETLDRANYRALDLDVIREAIAAPNEMGLTYIPDFSLFEHLRVYVRGYTRIARDCRNLRSKFRKQTVQLDAYQRMVVVIKFRPHPKLGKFVRSDVVYLRMFKDVPHVDMEMHLPEQGSKARMRWIDKAQVASPLMVSVPTMLARFLFTDLLATVLVSPLALASLIVAPLTASVNSFFGFQRNKQRHLFTMIQKLYYQTLANNASVLTRLIDSAEDEEYKEAMLAYFFLWRATGEPQALTIPALDDWIEEYLREKTGVALNFEVADAIGKLSRLGLVSRDAQDGLHAVSIDEALRRLDRLWDDKFRYV